MADRPRPPRIRARHAIAWIVLGWALSLAALVEAPLVKAAQARTWCVARTMVETGDWAVPSYNGEVRLKKPPLASWVQAASMEVAGSTDRRVAGLASWLLGVLFALGPLALGHSLGRPYAGFLGSLLLVTCRSAVVWGASPEHDVAFAGLIAFSLAWLVRALGTSSRGRDAILAGLCCGAAVLVKGPFALAFVFGTALVAGGARRARTGERSRRSLWTWLIAGALAPSVGWLVVLFVRLHGIGPVFDEMRRQALGEAGAHLKAGLANVFYYVGMIPKWAMPWSVVLIPMIGITCWRRRRGDATVSSLPSFAVRAFGVMLVALTVVPAKQEHYLLPILPVAFLLGGVALENELRRRGKAAPSIRWVLAGLSIAFALERLLASRLTGAGAPRDWLVAAALAAGGLATLFARRNEGARGATTLFFLVALPMTFVAGYAESKRNRRIDDVERSVEAIEHRLDATQPVLGFATGSGEAFDTIAAYLHRKVVRVTTVEDLRSRLAASRGGTVLVARPEAAVLAPLDDRLEPLGEIAPARSAEKNRVVVHRVRR